jgi:hypothetical protein
MKNINRVFLFGDSWIEGQGTYSEYIEGENPLLTEPTIPFGEDRGLGPQSCQGCQFCVLAHTAKLKTCFVKFLRAK